MGYNPNDRFEGGAHMTIYDRENLLSFVYYPGEQYITVAHGGYGEPLMIHIPLEPHVGPSNYPTARPLTITEFESIVHEYVVPSDEAPVEEVSLASAFRAALDDHEKEVFVVDDEDTYRASDEDLTDYEKEVQDDEDYPPPMYDKDDYPF